MAAVSLVLWWMVLSVAAAVTLAAATAVVQVGESTQAEVPQTAAVVVSPNLT